MVIGAAGARKLGSGTAGDDSIINDILSDGEINSVVISQSQTTKDFSHWEGMDFFSERLTAYGHSM